MPARGASSSPLHGHGQLFPEAVLVMKLMVRNSNLAVCLTSFFALRLWLLPLLELALAQSCIGRSADSKSLLV